MGTSSYLPGFSDDATSDFLADINNTTSKTINDEILKLDKKLMKSKDEELFWNKWMIANCITTSLKHGAYINVLLMKKAKEYYKYCLEHEEVKEYCDSSYKTFKKQVSRILNKINKMKPFKSGRSKKMVYYDPFFSL
jgi:hypothetical protein